MQTVVNDGAGKLASSARAEATAELNRQICSATIDGAISPQEQATITGQLETARTEGAPAGLIAAMQQVSSAGTTIPAPVTAAFIAACSKVR